METSRDLETKSMEIPYTVSVSPSADEMLFVLNRFRTVDLDTVEYYVVSGTHTPGNGEPAWPFQPGQALVVVDGVLFPHGIDIASWDTVVLWNAGPGKFGKLLGLEDLSELVASGAAPGVYGWNGSSWYACDDQNEALGVLLSDENNGDYVYIGDTDVNGIVMPEPFWPTTKGEER